MKVIGHTSNNKLLVEADGDELAYIMGLAGRYAAAAALRIPYDQHDAHRVFHIGMEIKVDKLWKIIEHERGRPVAITNTAKNLRSLADMLDIVNEALSTPDVEPKKEASPA